METLQITHLDISQIPEILLPIDDGKTKFSEKDYPVDIQLYGENLTLVFDVFYEEVVERTGNGITTEEQVTPLYTTTTVDNLRLEDEDCNVIPLDNLEELAIDLSKNKIKRGAWSI